VCVEASGGRGKPLGGGEEEGVTPTAARVLTSVRGRRLLFSAMPRQVSAMFRTALLLFLLGASARAQRAGVPQVGPGGVRALLRQVDALASEQCTRNVVAQWRYETDVNEETQLAAVRLIFSPGFRRSLRGRVATIPSQPN
jgi:hypothetical protein